MPKKHAPLYTQTKPSYVHPSLQRSPTSTTSTPSEPQTVTQRLHRLRREQAPRATSQQRDDFTSSVVSRTVPPELRRILHIPEVNAPKPKAGTRTRRVIGGARPPPGPAAPSSWLLQSRHTPAHLRDKWKKSAVEHTTLEFGTLARVTNNGLKRLPPPRSLVHHCLRTFALHWTELSEYEQHYIPSLPVSLKEALLSYLTLFGEERCLDLKSFKILFQKEEGADTSGGDELRFLDLTGLLNEHFTISDLGKCLKRLTAPVTVDFGALHIVDSSSKSGDEVFAGVAESWDEQVAELSSTKQPVLTSTLQTPHFTNLSRLSLAHPGRWASWPDFIRISPNLYKITHLSLAHWPRPSMTPNATTTSMVSKHTSVPLGGSYFYSDLDNDWVEARDVLRRLAVNTSSLHWLDLEGCSWVRALARSEDAQAPSVAVPVTCERWARAIRLLVESKSTVVWS